MDHPQPALSRWKALRYRGEWLCCATIATIVPRLPRRLCVALAQSLGTLAFYLDRRGRTVALANIAMAFGQRYTETERREIIRRSYQSFARTMVDLLWSSRLTEENWRDFLIMEGDLAVLTGLDQTPEKERRGAVLLCSHWGNFEWASLAIGFHRPRVHIVAEAFKNSHLSAIFNGCREVSGHTIIAQEYSMVRLLKIVKRRGFAGMLIDLTLRPEQAAVPVVAFDRPISATSLHAVLAQRGGAALVPVHGESLPDGRCRITIDPPLTLPEGATLQEIAQICWDHFAQKIEARPELWMWAYKHWRYRPKASSSDQYPFYSNLSGRFERLLKSTQEKAKKG